MTEQLVYSLTQLVKQFDLSLNPNAISEALVRAGVMREVSYLSTTGSGQEKFFREIAPGFLEFGINRWTAHEFKTEPRFHSNRFPDLVRIVIGQLAKEAQAMSI
jgi:hypothetical protein